MRKAPNIKLEKYRAGGPPETNFGLFFIPSPRGSVMKVMVSQGSGWDHVSVSLQNRTPTWEEMDLIRKMVFRDDELVVQFHVPNVDKKDFCDTCLHLWRPQRQEEIDQVIADWKKSGEFLPPQYNNLRSPGEIPMPPKILV